MAVLPTVMYRVSIYRDICSPEKEVHLVVQFCITVGTNG